MARPQSQTVKYFPHMANASQKKTVFALESRFGVAGYAAWFKTLELLASTEGHFLDLSDEAAWLHCCAFIKMNEEDAATFYDMCSRLGCICKEQWQVKIVFSQAFIEGVSDAYRKRKCSVPDAPQKQFTAEETEFPAEETPSLEDNRQESGGRNPQTILDQTRSDKTKQSPSDSFESFWTAYPKKVGKQDALKKYRAQKAERHLEAILKDIAYRKTTRQWMENGGQFIPNPSTYLNQRRWEDEVMPEHPTPNQPAKPLNTKTKEDVIGLISAIRFDEPENHEKGKQMYHEHKSEDWAQLFADIQRMRGYA